MDAPPPIRISEVGGRVRLGLEGFGDVEGATLQDAADELVAYMLGAAMCFRARGLGPLYSGFCPDSALLDFLWRLGDHAAAGGDPREFLFGPNALAA